MSPGRLCVMCYCCLNHSFNHRDDKRDVNVERSSSRRRQVPQIYSLFVRWVFFGSKPSLNHLGPPTDVWALHGGASEVKSEGHGKTDLAWTFYTI